MMTFKQILVATDFSESSERALDIAVELAHKFDAGLALVHSWEIPYSYGESLYLAADFVTPIQNAAAALLDSALVALQQRVPNATSVLRSGAPWQEILSAAQEMHADLLVLGTHGRRGLSHALLGSVAEKVVRMANAPVLTVHGTATKK